MIKYMQYLYLFVGCVIAVCVHAYVMALVSTRQGDPKPKQKGKLTLNPLVHLEPIGLILMFISGGYGWGHPVETSPVYYRDRKKGTLITYITPIIVNLLVGIIFVLLGNIFLFLAMGNNQNVYDIQSLFINLQLCFYYFASANIKFALFNIIPIYPLDGWKVLSVVVSPTTLVKLTNYEKLLQIILMFVLVSGLANELIGPMANVFLSIAKLPL